MNFNLLDKTKIDKKDFDLQFHKKDYNNICKYFYKIAHIVANNYMFKDQDKKENMIQDSVYIAYKRINGFDVKRGKPAFSYFYKVIDNNFKDILRKERRRENIARIVSYEVVTENSLQTANGISFNSSCTLSDNSQNFFVDYSNIVSFDNKKKDKVVKQEFSVDTEQTQFSFFNAYN